MSRGAVRRSRLEVRGSFRGRPDRAGAERNHGRREEEHEAGQVCYRGPGHVPVALEGSELAESSPSEDCQQVIDHVVAQAG
ncbi:hypothetical protein [Streptomyces sp. NPDC002788]